MIQAPDSATPALDDCLKLLRGERDEQKLAGLLLASKICQGDDGSSIQKVYDAVGIRFLNRLLMTGMGKGTAGVRGGDDRDVYLRLAVTVLAGFCRVPEIASSEEMVSKVPVVSEIISESSDPSIFEECYEFLLFVATTSENGATSFYKPGIMELLAPHISTLHEDSRSLEHAMRLLQVITSKQPADMRNTEYLSAIPVMVVSVARQFAVLHNALKFDALHLLTTLLSPTDSPHCEALRSLSNKNWGAYIRIGIAEILQNRVASSERLEALLLADSLMSILGENWLLEQSKFHDLQDLISVDKYLLLVLESSRIEVAVLLNELAYMRFEASNNSSTIEGRMLLKQQQLAVSFSLIEKIIKLISNVGAEGSTLSESTLTKSISGLNETINLVLDFLQDSKDNGQKRGNDLLAAIRIIGSFLAEAPYACKEKSHGLLEYMLSVEGEDEQSPFYSICFLLPMLCQLTMEIDGCKTLLSFGAHKIIAECLVKMISQNDGMVEDGGTIFLACDTILNLLQNVKELQAHVEGSHFVCLLQSLALWTGKSKDLSIIMMSSSICSLIFDITSEESLLNCHNFDCGTLQSLSAVIVKSLNQGEMSDNGEEHSDLHEIIASGYSRWHDRFPTVRNIVEHACMN